MSYDKRGRDRGSEGTGKPVAAPKVGGSTLTEALVGGTRSAPVSGSTLTEQLDGRDAAIDRGAAMRGIDKGEPSPRGNTLQQVFGRPNANDAPSAGAVAGADSATASPGVTRKMESAFGMSFSGVSLRVDDVAASRAASIGAKAYTDGSEIGFAKGAFDPESRDGQHVIAHEFAHVAQSRGGTPGAQGSAMLGYDNGASGADALSPDPEAQANAAADAVVAGEQPTVAPVMIGTAAYGDKKPQPPPPVGSYYVSISNGIFVYTFNTDEIVSWGNPLQRAYQYYVSNAFGRSAAEADAAAASPEVLGLKWEDSTFNPKKLPPHKAQPIGISKELHEKTKAYFAKQGIAGRDPSPGFKDTGDGPTSGGPGGPANKDAQKDGNGAQADATGKDPAVDTKDVADAKKIYKFLQDNFPDAVVFADDGVTQQDMLKFMAENPDGFKNLPAIPPDGKAIKNIKEWKEFLDKWKKAKDRGKDGTGDGNPDGVHHFHPQGKMILEPEVAKYVKGSSVTGRVNFDRLDSDNAVMNAVPERAEFDWTLVDTNNKLVSRSHSFWGRGDISWDATVPANGTYRLKVNVRSPYFWESLYLESKDILVTDEKSRDQEVFDDLLVGPDDAKPFTRGQDGKLQLKSGQKVLTPQQEMDLVDAQIGSLRALGAQGKLTSQQVDEYVKLLEQQKASLDKLREKIGGKRTYFTRGTFVSRENSASTPVKLMMYADEVSSRISDRSIVYKVMGYDSTLDPGNATQHPGEGHAPQSQESKAEYAAVDAMFTHIHDHNDYPDGSLHLAIQLEDGSIYEKTIDTHNWKKPAEKALGYVAIVGGVAMILAAPLTGGSSAVVGVIFVTTAVAGLASVALSMSEQYAKEGEIKVDGRLALNILQVVSLALGAGTFSAAFKSAGAIGKGMVLGTMLGLDVASGVLISQSVMNQIGLIEASYNPRIAAATDPVDKERLTREKEGAVAQVLGAAAVNGAFILVSVGQGIHAIKSISPSGKFYNVRPDIAELRKQYEYTRDPSDIELYIKDKPLTFEEKAFLEDVLAHIAEDKKSAGDSKELSPEQKAKLAADEAKEKKARDDAKKALEDKKAADANQPKNDMPSSTTPKEDPKTEPKTEPKTTPDPKQTAATPAEEQHRTTDKKNSDFEAAKTKLAEPEAAKLEQVQGLANDSELQMSAGLEIGDPLFGQKLSRALSAAKKTHSEAVAALQKQMRTLQGRMLDALRDPAPSVDARRAKLDGIVDDYAAACNSNKALLEGFDVDGGVARAREAIKQTVDGSFDRKMTLDGNGVVRRGKEEIGTFRSLVDKVVAANRAFEAAGVKRELVIAVSETPSGTREILMLSREKPTAAPRNNGGEKLPVQTGVDNNAAIVDIGAGESSFGIDLLDPKDRQGGPLVQTEYGPSAFDGSRMRKDLTWENAVPKADPNSAVVFGDPLQTMDLMFGDKGVKRVFINNVNAHYEPGAYQHLADVLLKTMTEGGRVEVQWTSQPEYPGGKPGDRGHIAGPELKAALDKAAATAGRKVDVEVSTPETKYNYSVEPSRRKGGASADANVPDSPIPEARWIFTFH